MHVVLGGGAIASSLVICCVFSLQTKNSKCCLTAEQISEEEDLPLKKCLRSSLTLNLE